MDEFLGVITYKLMNIGTKSEGYVPLLRVCVESDDEQSKVYKLCRADVLSTNDSYFEKYHNQEVVVRGVVQMGTWISVEDIIIKEDQENEQYDKM